MTRITLILGFCLLCSTHALAQTTLLNAGFVKAAEDALELYIRPNVEVFSRETAALTGDLSDMCEDPSAERLADVKRGFRAVAIRHAQVEILRFGPLVEQNRFERLYFWPDRRGLALKRVQRALKDRDESVLDAKNLRQKSVALQGLGGLEFLLFGSGSEGILNDPFRCQFATAVAGSIEQTARELKDAWFGLQGYETLLLEPGPENEAYRSPREVGAELFNVLKNSVEAIQQIRLMPVVGTSLKKAKPKRAALWRSRLSLPVLIAQIKALEDFQMASGLLANLPGDQTWINESARFEYTNVLARLSEIDGPIANAVIEDDARSKLTYTQTVMSNLTALYAEEAAPALGFSAGFNALDGD